MVPMTATAVLTTGTTVPTTRTVVPRTGTAVARAGVASALPGGPYPRPNTSRNRRKALLLPQR
jgi:hypothetical protein